MAGKPPNFAHQPCLVFPGFSPRFSPPFNGAWNAFCSHFVRATPCCPRLRFVWCRQFCDTAWPFYIPLRSARNIVQTPRLAARCISVCVQIIGNICAAHTLTLTHNATPRWIRRYRWKLHSEMKFANSQKVLTIICITKQIPTRPPALVQPKNIYVYIPSKINIRNLNLKFTLN